MLAGLVDVARGAGPDVRGIRERLIARYGAVGELQDEHDRAGERRSLSQPFADGAGLLEYTMVLDPEAKAVVEAAVQGLSAPRPTQGEPDRRPSGQRRMDALLKVVRRGVASSGGVPTTPKAELFVTVALDDETARVNAATVVGSTESGTLLPPDTARRIAVTPRSSPSCSTPPGRSSTSAAGSGCSPPSRPRRCGCATAATRSLTAPSRRPGATDTTLWHWADGGPTDTTNAALLCGRHHTLVHRHGYHAQLTPSGHVSGTSPPVPTDRWLTQRRTTAADRAVSDHAGGGPDPPTTRTSLRGTPR